MVPNLKQIENTAADALLTPVDIARLLACTPGAVRRNIKLGRFKAVCVAGKWYTKGLELKKMIVSNQIE